MTTATVSADFTANWNADQLLTILREYLNLAEKANGKEGIIQDPVAAGLIVCALESNSGSEVLRTSLEILFELTTEPIHRKLILSSQHWIYVKPVVQKLQKIQSLDEFNESLLKEIKKRLENPDLVDYAPPVSPPSTTIQNPPRITVTSSFAPANKPQQKHNRFLHGCGNKLKARTYTFQLGVEFSEAMKNTIQQLLLDIKGLISFQLDSNKRRCVTRTKLTVQPLEIAKQLHTATSSLVQQIVRNDFDDEELISFDFENKNPIDANETAKQPTNLPEYLPDDFGQKSPENDKAITRLGDLGQKPSKGGWWNSMSNFISDSLYW